jgi:hypothetical protein
MKPARGRCLELPVFENPNEADDIDFRCIEHRTRLSTTVYYANDTAGPKPGGIRLTINQRAAR